MLTMPAERVTGKPKRQEVSEGSDGLRIERSCLFLSEKLQIKNKNL